MLEQILLGQILLEQKFWCHYNRFVRQIQNICNYFKQFAIIANMIIRHHRTLTIKLSVAAIDKVLLSAGVFISES
jgi:hypothetical protein